jgi:Flp pilus assembly protein TadG
MRSKARRGRGESGQSIALVTVFIVPLLAFVAFVVDLGSWYHENRHLQSVTDSAALAGAAALPSQANASGAAQSYANLNAPGSASIGVSFPNGSTIEVSANESKAGIFSKIVGINTVNVSSTSRARYSILGTGYWVAPMMVSGSCGGNGISPCVGSSGGQNYLSYHHLGSCTGSSFSFCFSDLSNSGLSESGGGDGALSGWIRNGYPSPVSVHTTTGDYKTTDCKSPCTSTAGNMCGHNAVPASCVLIQAIQARAGQIILVPVFDPGQSKSSFYIRGFAIFRVASSNVFQNAADPAHWWIMGNYLDYRSTNDVVCQPPPPSGTPPNDGTQCYGTPEATPDPSTDLGAHSIALVK